MLDIQITILCSSHEHISLLLTNNRLINDGCVSKKKKKQKNRALPLSFFVAKECERNSPTQMQRNSPALRPFFFFNPSLVRRPSPNRWIFDLQIMLHISGSMYPGKMVLWGLQVPHMTFNPPYFQLGPLSWRGCTTQAKKRHVFQKKMPFLKKKHLPTLEFFGSSNTKTSKGIMIQIVELCPKIIIPSCLVSTSVF